MKKKGKQGCLTHSKMNSKHFIFANSVHVVVVLGVKAMSRILKHTTSSYGASSL